MIFVCAAFDQMPAEMLDFSRLYAYPRLPDPPPIDGIVILDSGAYGLAMRGQKMTRRHIMALADHYRQHCGEAVIGIGPDEYLSPATTTRNFDRWCRDDHPPAAPVIQFERKGVIGLWSVREQALFYAERRAKLPTLWNGRAFVCVSNPGLRGAEAAALNLKRACDLLRGMLGDVWLHNLGAGWDLQDIAAYREMACFDSIDSVSYYTDAQRGRAWLKPAATWRELALENARAAASVAGGSVQ